MNDLEYQSLLRSSCEYLDSRKALLSSELSLGCFDAWKYDLNAGKLFYLKGGKPGVEAEIQVVGSVRLDTREWTWSWADSRFSEEVVEEIHRLKEFGEQNEVECLIKANWPASEDDGWDMSAIAAGFMQADATYRFPKDNGLLFIVARNVRWIGFN